jgi:tRNA (guanine-N7-)-methyltransferase
LSRRKLIHFDEMDQMPHVLQHPVDMPGQWANFWGNDHPMVLEVGCGTGNYVLGLATRLPDWNVIGADIKGARMWHGATKSRDLNLSNVAFLRCRLEQLPDYFGRDEVSELWITFPDPQPRASRERKRLTSLRFLHLYHRILRPGARIHLKTDDPNLFAFSVETWRNACMKVHSLTYDLYAGDVFGPAVDIQTTYESRFLAEGKKIHYMCAEFTDEFPVSAVQPLPKVQ